MNRKLKSSKKKYWYMFYIEECPLCGFTRETRGRCYGKKPKYTREFSTIAYHCGY